MAYLADAAALRRIADSLDRMAEMTAQTGVTLCAYGTDHVEVDGITLPIQPETQDGAVRYVVDLAGQ